MMRRSIASSPLAAWVTDNYPEDALVMYDGTAQVTTDESVALWREHRLKLARDRAVSSSAL